MFNLSNTAKHMLWIIFALYNLLCVGGYVVYNSSSQAVFSFIGGLSLGAAMSAIKVVMLERAISRSLDMGKEQASRYAALMFALRSFVTAAVLATAAITKIVNLWGVVAGLLTLQFSAYAVNLLFKDKG